MWCFMSAFKESYLELSTCPARMKGHAGATFLRQVGEKARHCAQHSSLSVHVCCQGSCRPGARAWTDRINKGVWRVFVLIEESLWKVLGIILKKF